MFTYSLVAAVIALAVAVAAQLFYSAGFITTDMRNLCFTAFLAWCGIASTVFVFGAFAAIEVFFR